jgi:hypothetical protein
MESESSVELLLGISSSTGSVSSLDLHIPPANKAGVF